MTINNYESYVRNIWSFTELEKEIRRVMPGTKIGISDIDGIIERGGRYLVYEFKSPGKNVPIGQRILLQSLIDSGLATVLIVRGEPNKVEAITVKSHKGTTVVENPSNEKLAKITASWLKWADKQEKPKRADVRDDTLW